ncbi:hypothetical protein OG989_16305 [Micromonospora sp. NBC_01740]|uniref:hypothetical protein n=1 Tax=Micromonospora sp. NBC_01740 TaxID=2975986 RepID=UPI002E159EB0|nr:hypothetical protein OG989_16305 [Micromonospora sp. NBC_01740]
MPRKQARQVKAFVMHGRTPRTLLNYDGFFRWLADLPTPATEAPVAQDQVLAVAASAIDGEFIHFRFVSGNPRGIPLLFNRQTGTTQQARTPENTWLAQPTRVSVIPKDRLIFIENRRRGVSSSSLERYFFGVSQKNGYGAVDLDLDPLPAPSLEREILDLTRIKEASIVVNRPNTDWNDASDVLSELAGSSGGKDAAVVVHAPRGQSLSKSEGIINVIVSNIRRRLPNIRDMKVVGRRLGEPTDHTVSLEKHQMRAVARVDDEAPLDEQDESVREAVRRLAQQALPVVRRQGDATPQAEST